MKYVFELTLRAVFFSGEWLDLGEYEYRFFASQFLELERVANDLNQGHSL